MGELDGRVAVVTGAARGIGRAHALTLAAAGATVVVNDLDGADVVVGEIAAAGGEAEADDRALGSVTDGRALVERAIDAFGRIDVVVHNAGVSVPTDVADLDDDTMARHLGVHLLAAVGTTAEALTAMASAGWGRIVTTVSGHGLEPRNPGSAAYAAAKAAVYGFTRAAALEAPPGVTVNAVAPLAFTRMSEGYLSRIEGAEERFDPAHVARVVAWLCTDGAGSVNGRVIRVEGDHVGEYDVGPSELVPFDRWIRDA